MRRSRFFEILDRTGFSIRGPFHPGARVLFRFAEYTLDSQRRELRRGGVLRSLEPQVFDVLLFLIQHRHRVVARQELLTAVWRGRNVSEAALDTRISAARNAIGDNGVEQRLIRTLRGKGFRFVASVHSETLESNATHIIEERDNDPVFFDYPAIAVLPLDSTGADPRQRALADGIADDLITALSKIGWLSVAAGAASFSAGAQFLTHAQVAKKIGVRYLLNGSVREQADRIRITLRLVDAVMGRQIWTDSSDQDTVTGFALQDQICERIMAAIEPQLFIAEHLRIQRKEAANCNDWECLVRALSLMNTRVEKNIAAAHALLNKAVLINPHSARNSSLQSIATTLRVHMSWADRQDVIPTALAVAHKALTLNPEEPWAHAALGYASIWRDPQQAITALERAIALNPRFAVAHYFLALAATYAGHNGEYAFSHANEAEECARRDLLMRGYMGAHDNVRATACFAAERYSQGSHYARRAATYSPNSPTAYRALLMNLALGGQVEKAKDALRMLRRLAPKMSQTWIKENAMWTSAGASKRYMEAFRIAGL